MEGREPPPRQSGIRAFMAAAPKAELHVHLEGCLYPELIHRLSIRNEVHVDLDNGETSAGHDKALEMFFDRYFKGMQVLITEHDFYEVVRDYVDKVAEQNVMHVEMFFDPQAHLERGIEFKTIIAGVQRAASYARTAHDMSFSLIMCFLREKSVESAMRVLQDAAPFRNIITGVGLDGDPTQSLPRQFKDVFQKAREMGFNTTAHCDIMPSDGIEQIRQSVEDLKVDRLDHASCIFDDESLTVLVRDKELGITCCPRTNVLLHQDTGAGTIRLMLAKGLKCSVHSDDPGHFEAYINDNLQALSDEGLELEDMDRLVRNSIESSWASSERKRAMLHALDSCKLQDVVRRS
ncbi:hypothetical protein M409DRAFT_37689 [Zasmidium cellare ATCC 36951]|uniref:Adenosine deaminase domain-containing protein n=1 Tax=Zasmidium cellare ATCC 36951 TaxID=1080233 RepID=A0A6A6C2X2_ZASCE|nr:uncharacterized protein M409DRAFT_37689 [Zasmidium cellare ATCC 36951]KAF2160638.1 hypothetical protein M409DRAFT_37689 [Zasmidium cellare ATCC 36951]